VFIHGTLQSTLSRLLLLRIIAVVSVITTTLLVRQRCDLLEGKK
jgi:hypothetical protein